MTAVLEPEPQTRLQPQPQLQPQITLEPVDGVEITTLIDNSSDLLLRSDDIARRRGFGDGARVEAPLMLDPQLPRFLIAEHGFSAMVTITKGGRSRRLMFDAGISVGGLAHNLDVLELKLADFEAIVMSHGHFDHVGGLNGLIKQAGAARLPMLVHPDFWLRRRVVVPGQEPFELFAVSRGALEGAGFEIIEGEEPSLLLDGSALITGEVARKTEFERGFPVHQARRNDEWTPDPLILDDQALIVNVRDRGLVVLTGCGHSGIVNIVRHAQALTGETRVRAIVGGFHLGGPLFEPIIPQTVEALAAIAPDAIVPAHCTGFAATRAIADALPDALLLNAVGTRFVL
jgi:7,8-dihydropterin-6-yl-methyl-4-(beta-D-ribofuranosyl)aminobenzene 5'-phosphate synthase